jgi:cell division protein FtsW
MLLPVVWVVLAITMIKGQVIAGANASRWLQIPYVGISFQPSAFAALVLFVFVARYLSKTREEPIVFVESLKELWLPVFITLMNICHDNYVGIHW